MMAPIVITVDDRERASEVAAWLSRAPDVCLTVARLEAGDVEVAGMAVFERKTVADFARSVVDGRLFRQAARLAASRLPATVILEGAWPEGRDIEGVDRRAFQGAAVSLAAVFRIPLLYAADARETARLIRFAAAQMHRSAAGTLPRPGYRPKGRRRRQLYLLQGLPGVGPGRAVRLLDRFGSVEQVMAAPERELATVDGIGKGTARAIRAVVQEAPATYTVP